MAGWVIAGGLLVVSVAAVVVAARRGRRLRAAIDDAAQRLAPRTLDTSPDLGAAVGRLDRVVTEHLAAAAGADDGDRRLLAAFDVLPQGVVLADAEGRVRYNNPVAEAFQRGRHGEALVAVAVDELLGQAARGDTVDREIELFGPPKRVLYVSAQPVSESGSQVATLVLIDDVTDHQRVDEIRRDFVANISHELRTPIGALSLLAETLEDETDPEVIAMLAARIHSEALRVGGTVEDLLELTRIEHGSELTEIVDVRDAVATAVDRATVAAEQKGLSLGTQLPDRALMVVGDLRQLSSGIYNLIDNAVKYTGPGGTVGVRAHSSGDMIEVRVHDTGVGIPGRDLDRIFERFYRVDRARTRDKGGSGLGLSIVRHVAANHGGRVSVDSTEGEGSTFTLMIPQADVIEDIEAGDAGPAASDGGVAPRQTDWSGGS